MKIKLDGMVIKDNNCGILIQTLYIIKCRKKFYILMQNFLIILDGSGGYFLSSPNVHTALSMPVLLSIVVIITVIIGIALSLVVFLVRKW